MNARDHDKMMDCMKFILKAHAAIAEDRSADDWIEQERECVATAANIWAMGNGMKPGVTLADVECCEVSAIGHIDYMRKLALYVSEFLFLEVNKDAA